MKVNIEKAVKNINTKVNFYRPLYEAIMNSFQADAQNIDIMFDVVEENHTKYIRGYSIIDDGVGFTDKNIDSFLTLWSTYNADKGALGSGRILCLKVFNNIKIDSTLHTKSKSYKVLIDFNTKFNFNSVEEISKVELSQHTPDAKNITKTSYEDITNLYKLEERYLEIDKIKKTILDELLLQFIDLKNSEKDFLIRIDGQNWLDKKTLKEYFENRNIITIDFKVTSSLKDDLSEFSFKLTYTIDKNGKNNLLQFYGASGRKVMNFPASVKISRLPDDASAVFFLTSDYLKNMVSDSREKFMLDINENNATERYPLLFSDINKELRKHLNIILETNFPSMKEDFTKEKQQASYNNPHLITYIKEINQLALKEKDIVAIAEKKFTKRFIDTKKSIIDFTQNILKTKDFNKEKYIEITQNFTEVGQEQLAHYIAYRQTIIEMLSYAYTSTIDKTETFSEDYIHNLIMPPKKIKINNRHIITDNNFWLFDDKFMTYSFAASDDEIEKILTSLADEESEFEKNVTEVLSLYGDDRPDLLMLFSADKDEPRDAVLVELKKLHATKYEKTKSLDQLMTYGRIIKQCIKNIRDVYVYSLISFDPKIEDSLLDRGFHPKILTRDGHNIPAYYKYNDLRKVHENVLSFEHLILDASKRNRLFLDILRNEIAN